MLRYSISQVSSLHWSFEQDVRYCAELGAPALSLLRAKLEACGVETARRLLRESGVAVSGLGSIGHFSLHEPERWPEELERARREIEVAGELGARTVTLLSGSGRGRPYRESEAAFRKVLEVLLPAAERAGVILAFEPNGPLRVDLGFVHTLHDALDLVDAVGSPWLRICCELNNAWVERFLYEDIRERCDRIALVQVNDFAEGTLCTPDRVPLGDGIIPLPRILAAFEAAGYDGYYEIELIGPAIEKLGYEEAIARSVRYLERCAATIGAGS